MSKRIFIDGNINSELCVIAADGQEINYFDYSDELATSKKNMLSRNCIKGRTLITMLLLNLDQKKAFTF